MQRGFVHTINESDNKRNLQSCEAIWISFHLQPPVLNTSASILIAVKKKFILTYGSPGQIISDRGPCVVSEDWEDFDQAKRMQFILNAVNHLRANGKVEQINTVLKPMLAVEADTRRNMHKFAN
ncbi:hypothetical protein FQR65_LT08961 [Abscondita terminalis]|nr:hypothetical protein FQR65_LT08961 [Abscondita terminalis]